MSANSKTFDEGEFAELVEPFRPRLERCALLLIGDADEAVNIAQAAIVIALDRLGEFRAAQPLYPWVRGITVNLSRQFVDRRRRQARSTEDATLNSIPHRSGRKQGALSEILRKETAVRLAMAISELPIPYREAFVLHYIEEMDYSEISEMLGESATALRTRAMRARGLLQSSLGSVVDTWMREQKG